MSIDVNRCQSIRSQKSSSSIININRLIDIDCHRLISILIDHRFHRLVTPGKRDSGITIKKKADKGSTTVVMNTEDKKQEGQIQLDNINHYRPLETPMVIHTQLRVEQLINDL